MRSKSSPVVRDEPTFIEAARRSQIIECAIDAMAELGYERASLAEIAKRARVSKSVISYYFASKDDLIERVVTHVYTAAGAFMSPRVASQKTALSALRAFITANAEFIGTHRREVQAVVEIITSSRLPDGRPRFDVSRQEQSIADLEQLFRWGQQTGEFRPFATDVMAITLRVAMDALSPRLLMFPDIDVAQYAAELSALFTNATKKA